VISEYDEALEAKATKPPATVIEITERRMVKTETWKGSDVHAPRGSGDSKDNARGSK
jgi:hypothetical protein